MLVDAVNSSCIGVHSNILALICARRSESEGLRSSPASSEQVVELIWEYVTGYSLEKMILTGELYSAARRLPQPIDANMKR
jgi:hypothetical protein